MIRAGLPYNNSFPKTAKYILNIFFVVLLTSIASSLYHSHSLIFLKYFRVICWYQFTQSRPSDLAIIISFRLIDAHRSSASPICTVHIGAIMGCHRFRTDFSLFSIWVLFSCWQCRIPAAHYYCWDPVRWLWEVEPHSAQRACQLQCVIKDLSPLPTKPKDSPPNGPQSGSLSSRQVQVGFVTWRW